MPITLILFLIFFLVFIIFCVKAYMGGAIKRKRVRSEFRKQGCEITRTELPLMIDDNHKVWGIQGSTNVFKFSDVSSVEIVENEVPMTQYDTTTYVIDNGTAPTKNTVQVQIHLKNEADPMKIDVCKDGARTDSQQYLMYKNNALKYCSIFNEMIENN